MEFFLKFLVAVALSAHPTLPEELEEEISSQEIVIDDSEEEDLLSSLEEELQNN